MGWLPGSFRRIMVMALGFAVLAVLLAATTPARAAEGKTYSLRIDKKGVSVRSSPMQKETRKSQPARQTAAQAKATPSRLQTVTAPAPQNPAPIGNATTNTVATSHVATAVATTNVSLKPVAQHSAFTNGPALPPQRPALDGLSEADRARLRAMLRASQEASRQLNYYHGDTAGDLGAMGVQDW
jgi:hypothetical protein